MHRVDRGMPLRYGMRRVKRLKRLQVSSLGITLVLSLVGASFLCTFVAIAQDDPKRSGRVIVYVADVEALIHPISAEFISQTIERADAGGAELVVFNLRTPGGLVDSTRTINSSIIEADTPVAIFVSPSGTRAASAGFLITIAADIAAMAPGTHIGAAHPVSGTGSPMDETMAEKAASDVAAYARSLANRRGRNVDLAESAVTESQSFTEEEALEAEPPLIDLIADDLNDLLEQLDGREITRWNSETVVLNTANAKIETIAMTWRQQLLSAIAHPQVAVLLFSLGTLGLTIELWNPGGIVPGVVGSVCLLLAFFAFQILPINYVGLLLISFGLVLLVLETLTPTYGVLAAGGLTSMVLGGLMLMDSAAPELQLGLPFILSTMLALGAIVAFLVRLVVHAQRSRPKTGRAGMLDEVGKALGAIVPGSFGRVLTHGEIWSATSEEAIHAGEQVRVVDVDGMKLTVRRDTSTPPGGTSTWN